MTSMRKRITTGRAILATLAVLGLAACGGSSNDSPARTYQSVNLPMDLELLDLTDEQRTTFCSWINDPANQPGSDPTQAGTDPVVVKACLAAFATYPLCTVGQYDACMKANFADPNGALPDACKAIASCPVISPVQFDIAPPSRVCDGTMMPGSVRWCDVDGTAKDMTTGRHWLKDANCSEQLQSRASTPWRIPIPDQIDYYLVYSLNFPSANEWAAALSSGHCGLLDRSSPGVWHLPSLDQFLSLRSGGEAVSTTTPRLFAHLEDYPQVSYWWSFFWTTTPAMYGNFQEGSLRADWTYARGMGSSIAKELRRLPVREALPVTSISSITTGEGYSMAPANALNAVAGSSNYTRSYLTFPIWLPAPGRIGLSSWDNATRTPRIFYFEAATANPDYFRIWYTHGSNVRFNLAVEANSVHPGAGVIGWPDAGGDNRLWKPEFVDGGAMLKSKLSGLCMHIETNDGLFLRQDPCDATNPGQVFVLTPRQDG